VEIKIEIDEESLRENLIENGMTDEKEIKVRIEHIIEMAESAAQKAASGEIGMLLMV